ncbi:(2Fe-2S)-binding protein [Bifidobacterium pseudocatenulatum]|nr:(2Fe-2S)-binding protein [Bifidobacterium pseudocatenulatum]MCB4871947.1 (2Fe-2S)-binding protein [Bifidobacterium pseudocatenulatum]MCB4873699.1 (2Fe-2S)-binding protein [Bifidobacterium pseudocatenulatum]MCB4879014.1 (2Fe-2S)-binding protein [Bifidobacterium pseudocatenulatum]MCB4894946.1 (2Fe-2S)-binding protein [Bifidobacterium pseudocatenulatum]
MRTELRCEQALPICCLHFRLRDSGTVCMCATCVL